MLDAHRKHCKGRLVKKARVQIHIGFLATAGMAPAPRLCAVQSAVPTMPASDAPAATVLIPQRRHGARRHGSAAQGKDGAHAFALTQAVATYGM